MGWQLKNKPQNEHASNVGAMIARTLSVEYGIPAFIYNGITDRKPCEEQPSLGFPPAALPAFFGTTRPSDCLHTVCLPS